MPNKLDAGKVTMAADVTQGGYAADARMMNAALQGTFANEVNSRMNNAYELSGGVSIQENSDLNTFTAVGNYYCFANFLAESLLNCPITNAFTMKVEAANGIATNYIGQTVIDFFSGNRYYRVFDHISKRWNAWHSFAGTAMGTMQS